MLLCRTSRSAPENLKSCVSKDIHRDWRVLKIVTMQSIMRITVKLIDKVLKPKRKPVCKEHLQMKVQELETDYRGGFRPCTYGLWSTKILTNCSKSFKTVEVLVLILTFIRMWRTRKAFLDPPLDYQHWHSHNFFKRVHYLESKFPNHQKS